MLQRHDKKFSRISSRFDILSTGNQKAFIPFITSGFPDVKKFLDIFKLLDTVGADVIEIGLPFSDPLADGPIIQKTSSIALENGINTKTTFKLIEKIRARSTTPIVLLVYFNMIYSYGVKRFLADASSVGIDGIIIPDLPFEEFYIYRDYFEEYNIDNIMIVSLTSTDDRLKKILGSARGFIYCISLKGVTGMRDFISQDIGAFIEKIKAFTSLPIAVGFGISNITQVKHLKDKCDGIIVGSKILDIVLRPDNFKKNLKELEGFCSKVVAELKT